METKKKLKRSYSAKVQQMGFNKDGVPRYFVYLPRALIRRYKLDKGSKLKFRTCDMSVELTSSRSDSQDIAEDSSRVQEISPDLKSADTQFVPKEQLDPMTRQHNYYGGKKDE